MIIEKKTIWDVLETLLSTFYACIYAEKNEIKRISIGIAFEIACVAFAIFIGVSKWESLLKNIASIAATLFLIAEAGKKIIELF